jgi:hypothetical protein
MVIGLMDEFIEYEAMTFALGGDVACPDCEIGILIPTDDDNNTLICDVCDIIFEIKED